MAKKISQLTQATEVKSDDVTVIVQDGETKKLPLNMMVTKQDIENKKIAGLAKLDEIEATYENDTYTPTITVKNKSSVKVGEGDGVDYSANVMDGHVKSAILSGQTLVNLLTQESSTNMYTTRTQINRGYRYTQEYGVSMGATRIQWDTANNGHSRLKPNTKYYVQFTVKVNKSRNVRVSFEGGSEYATTLAENSTTTIRCSVLCGESLKRFFVYIYPPLVESYMGDTFDILDFMTIEYQDGMENWDIPYFEGMQSVKMPVLTTTGKNLWRYGELGEFGVKIVEVNIPKGTYFFSGEPTMTYEQEPVVRLSDATKQKLVHGYINSAITADFDIAEVVFYSNGYSYTNSTDKLLTLNNFMMEQGDKHSSYEPYKTNILTVNEDVELRGIGDVRDELNCLTGEVTQRVGEIVLDGSENWQRLKQGRYYLNNILNNVNRPDMNIVNFKCDKLKTISYTEEYNGTLGIALYETTDYDFIVRTDIQTTEEFKQWLSNNPTTVQYQLKTKSVKTVDLMPSGTHSSTTPYCWKNGHIQLSSSGLLPNLEYSVVTSRAGQINQNATMIVKNDKRIFDLEILLAGGLVNTTYQALTLQNQVETGLSKVSLNSETEPDYLLYHMIMKLIEEKAYKLDDLTEKVSVFYLYEKLSDEQFETIYSALYPFVEDEIVEEPVVEELPEVVEDEVIM